MHVSKLKKVHSGFLTVVLVIFMHIFTRLFVLMFVKELKSDYDPYLRIYDPLPLAWQQEKQNKLNVKRPVTKVNSDNELHVIYIMY
jgi:hypothetical protein